MRQQLHMLKSFSRYGIIAAAMGNHAPETAI
jgi:hypothetical protein